MLPWYDASTGAACGRSSRPRARCDAQNCALGIACVVGASFTVGEAAGTGAGVTTATAATTTPAAAA